MAARWAGYRYWHDWQELTSTQQAYLIAAYRTENRMKAAEAWHQYQKAKHGRA